MAEQKGSSSPIGGLGAPKKPKGLLDAYSEIQQYGFVEKKGSPIDESFVSADTRIAFWGTGVRISLVSGLITSLMTPLGVGVFKGYVPIFGTSNLTIFDKSFAILIAITFSMGYGLFLMKLGNYYVGGVTRTLIKSLMGGFATGSLIKSGIVFIFFHIVYFKLLEPLTLARLFKQIPLLTVDIKKEIIYFLYDFRNVFLISAWFVLITTILMLLIPLISIWLKSRKVKNILEREKQYQ